MPQFFVDKNIEEGQETEIRGKEAHHISSVLRLSDGDWIVLSDGKGNSFKATIISATARSVRVKMGNKIEHKVNIAAPTLALALIKPDRFEWAIQKAIELGCKTIIPFISTRCAYKADKLDRWQKIAHEAAKQSGLPFEPKIEPIVELKKLCEYSNKFPNRYLFYEGEKDKYIKLVEKKSDLLIVGPEGGFTPDEIICAKRNAITTISLGSQILRVETAAIATLTIWQYELGNMN